MGALSLAFLLSCADEEEVPLGFNGTLSGANEVPPVATAASGAFQVSLRDRQLELSGTFNNLESDLVDVAGSPAHVHQAAAGAAGPIVFNVDVSSSDRRNGTFTLSRSLSAEEDDLFRQGNYYLNIHTVTYPGGEIRVQLTAAQPERTTFSVELSGDKEVPPVTTSATGVAQVEVLGDVLVLTGSFQGLESNLYQLDGSAAHIHRAPEGQAGPIVFPVEVIAGADSRSGTFRLVTPLDEGQRQAFDAGELYFNIHSETHTTGEIRTQLRSAAPL